MTTRDLLGILVGGLLPAILFAFSNVFAKGAMQSGLSKPFYLIFVGLTVFCCGLAYLFFMPDRSSSAKSIGYAVACGISWALGTTLFVVAVTYYQIPLSKLVPLNNTSTLFAILLGFWIFSEWAQVNSVRLISGAILIVVGSIIVSKA